VIAPQALSQSQGDAGWGRRGAFVAMQENALGLLGGHVMGPSAALPPRLQHLGVDRPRISFSEVLSLDINGEAIHIVRQPAGYSNADAIVHFHVANVIYMGEVFPGDGYPAIDRSQHGRLEGLLNTLGSWTGSEFHIVPARGNVTDGNVVKAFRDMILTVQDRIRPMIAAGQTERQIVAAHPTAEFDAQWGHGRVTPDAFVREVYAALAARKAK
jgi:cyclase